MGPLCHISIYGSPVTLLNFQLTPQIYTLDVLWLQKEGTKVFDVNSTVSLVSCLLVQQVSCDVCVDADFLFDFDIQRTSS